MHKTHEPWPWMEAKGRKVQWLRQDWNFVNNAIDLHFITEEDQIEIVSASMRKKKKKKS